jgi:NitT/TauT family transport system substrate-binding protein
MPGTKEFKIAFTSPGLSTSPFLAALDAMEDDGYSIDITILDASELLAEGTAAGEFAFASGANNGILAAVEKGANLKAIVARVQNEWTLYARNEITTCEGLAGKRVAIHSQGAVSTAMVRNYIQENCPGTEPEYVVIEGSPNRVAALLADQIDASPVELGDSIQIDAEASDRFSLLTSFAADLPDLQTTSVYVNGDFADENPGTVLALVKALLDQFKKIDGDAAYLKSIAEEFVPDAINAATIDAATQKYVELKMFPVDGGVTAERMQYTAEFFGPDGTGATKTVIAADQWTDLSFLEMALGQ